MVKVSVIIPAYNGDRYISRAIAGVMAQTYKDYEIIVVDDGSTDNTRQVLQQYGDCLKYLSQANQGVAASRNLGLRAAQGEYIAFLDQDDVFLPHKLAAQVALLEQDPNLGMVNSGWEIVNDQEEIQSAVTPWRQIPDLSLANLIIWKPVFLGAMMFRRSWLERSSGFDTSLEQTPDVDLVLKLAAMGCKAAWVEQTTVLYRQHEGNASNDTLLQAQELERIVTTFFAQPDLDPKVKSLATQSRYQTLIWSAWRLQQSGCLKEMQNYLYQSWLCDRNYPTKTMLDWIGSFRNYSAEYGKKFNVIGLTSSEEWQELIKHLVSVW